MQSLQEHAPGDPKCISYEVQHNIIALNGEDNVLSNVFACEITLYGITHICFQHTKALRCGDQEAAVQSQNAVDGLSAKRL